MGLLKKIKAKLKNKKSISEYGASADTVDFFFDKGILSANENRAEYEVLPEFQIFKDYFKYYGLMRMWGGLSFSRQDILLQSMFINEKVYNFTSKNYIPLIYKEYSAVLSNDELANLQRNGVQIKERNYDKLVVDLNVGAFSNN